jgi:hypothetical protein
MDPHVCPKACMGEDVIFVCVTRALLPGCFYGEQGYLGRTALVTNACPYDMLESNLIARVPPAIMPVLHLVCIDVCGQIVWLKY